MKNLRRISETRAFTHVRILTAVLLVLSAAALLFLTVSPPAAAQPTARPPRLTPKFSAPVAFDVSPAVRDLPPAARPLTYPPDTIVEPRERGLEGPKAHRVKRYRTDGALQPFSPAPSIPALSLTFEGLSNLDKFNLFGFRIITPDLDGEVD